jgi:predicted Ser/Thr protein kinase
MVTDMGTDFDAKAWLAQLSTDLRDGYARTRRVMSFGEYIGLLHKDMRRQARSAAQYLRDVFDFFGTTKVRGSRGEAVRFNLFDCPWDGGKDCLRGQEEVQGAIYRLISNFAREGRTNRLILLHGPNGSAKSTVVNCIERAMEHYSRLDEGALYRFNWIFPVQNVSKGGIGFGGPRDGIADAETYAYLDGELVEAKISDELRDHPLLLLPRDKRRELLTTHLADEIASGFHPARYLLDGDLSHRNQRIFEALLGAYHGDLARVLRHVQVERFFISRRYRQSVATVEPQIAVDVRTRQLSMDRSLTVLPSALQSVSLFEMQGELVDANRGMLNFEDLLKRPFESWKYLLGVVENGSTSLDFGTLEVDTVFFATSNESFLAAFKEVPEFQSFKGRMELVRAPYLLDVRVEKQIYDEHVQRGLVDGSARHLAPHVAWVAALWAVLTRLRRPQLDKYTGRLADLIARLGPLDKALLYSLEGSDTFSHEEHKELLAAVDTIARETDSDMNYEGRSGASPREMKLVLLNAAQSLKYACASPFAVLDELEELVRATSVYEFLRQPPAPGGYHENAAFVDKVRERLLARISDEVRISMGLVEERRYIEHFERYVTHVSYWVKREKVPNPVTGADEEPDQEFMADVERLLGVRASGMSSADFRGEVIAKIGAWSLDNLGKRPDYERIFPRPIADLREAFFSERKRQITRINQDLLVYLVDGPDTMVPDEVIAVRTTLDNLKQRFGYCDKCAKDAVLALLKKR